MTTNGKSNGRSNVPIAPNQAVLFPAYTEDYRIGEGKTGYGLFANHKFKKGKLLFADHSLEYHFADVQEGDMLLLDKCEKATRMRKKSDGGSSSNDIPRYFPVTREMLLRTHGVPTLYPPDPETATDEKAGGTASSTTAGIIRWKLEVPGMLVNHSCDPNMSDFPPCAEKGEGHATRTIRRGDEITCDYVLQYYDRGPFFEECLCGSANCRGSMMGFKALSDEEKERLLPAASLAVQAMHRADVGEGPPVVEKGFDLPQRSSSEDVFRLLCPPPSSALAGVEVKKRNIDSNDFALYASKDFRAGQIMYEFFNQTWPSGVPEELDMVFATSLIGGNDPPEGTVVRIKARDCAPKNRNGLYMFSSWQLLTQHSCDPNVVVDRKDDAEDYDDVDEGYWCTLYATRDIQQGEVLAMDYNSVLWDRSTADDGLDPCHCGADTCVGTVRGFKYLPREAQEERKHMPWNRSAHDGTKRIRPGEALSAHVRVEWRKETECEDLEASDSEDDESDES